MQFWSQLFNAVISTVPLVKKSKNSFIPIHEDYTIKQEPLMNFLCSAS